MSQLNFTMQKTGETCDRCTISLTDEPGFSSMEKLGDVLKFAP
jgi:hypothetical protein